MKPNVQTKTVIILGKKYMIVKYICRNCNRYFRDTNLHDKTSRCGRLRGFGAGIDAKERQWINEIGVDKAIKRAKP